jgi:hypothetical protein
MVLPTYLVPETGTDLAAKHKCCMPSLRRKHVGKGDGWEPLDSLLGDIVAQATIDEPSEGNVELGEDVCR